MNWFWKALSIALIWQSVPAKAVDEFESAVVPIQVKSSNGRSQKALAARISDQIAVAPCSALREAVSLTSVGTPSKSIKLVGIRASDNICLVQLSTTGDMPAFAKRDSIRAGVGLIALVADLNETTSFRRIPVTVERKSYTGRGRALFLAKSNESALDGALLFLPDGAFVGVSSAIYGTSGEFAATLLESKERVVSIPNLPASPSAKGGQGEVAAALKPHADSIGTLFSFLNLATYYSRTRDYEKAVVLSEKWKTADPDNPAAWSVSAGALSRMQFTENAFKELDRALSIDSTYPPALFAKVLLLYKVGKPTEGELEANKAVSKIQVSDDLDEATVVGLLLFGKRLDEAKERERTLARTNAREPYVNDLVCTFEVGNGDADVALESCRSFVERAPESVSGWVRLADAYLRKGRFDDSIAAAKRGLSISIESADAWRVLGLASEAKGETKAAAEAEQRISDFEPTMLESYKTRRSVAVCTRDFGEKAYGRAVTTCQEAVRLNAKSAQAYALLGAALLRDKRLDEGIAAQERAVALDPKRKGSWQDLVIAYAQKKDATRARASLERLASLDKQAADELAARLKLQ